MKPADDTRVVRTVCGIVDGVRCGILAHVDDSHRRVGHAKKQEEAVLDVVARVPCDRQGGPGDRHGKQFRQRVK